MRRADDSAPGRERLCLGHGSEFRNYTARITASFGFRAVPEAERQGLVNKVFASVADRYDLMNDLMSGGLHRLWKRELITMLNAPRGATPFKLLDVAGGTGDIAMRYAKDSGPNGNRHHLRHQPRDARRRPPPHQAKPDWIRAFTCVEGNAEELPFESGSFDAYTIAFGIRNVTHIDKALAEAYRVLKPGGRWLCLEFSECQVPIFDRLYDFHSFEIIPRLGQVGSRRRRTPIAISLRASAASRSRSLLPTSFAKPASRASATAI